MNHIIYQKITLLGNFNVGKTSMILKLITGYYNSTIESTIGASYFILKYPNIYDKVNMYLQIWDTAGQERFAPLAPMYIRGSDGIVIVYDMNSIDNLKSIKYWLNLIDHLDIIIYIVGNKADINDYKNVKEIEEFINIKGYKHFTTSVKNDNNIIDVFKCFTDDLNNRIPHDSPIRFPQVKDIKTIKTIKTIKNDTMCCYLY